MEYGVFDPADVLVDWHPVIDRLPLEGGWGARRTEAQEIPRRVDERVERICLTPGGPMAARTVDILPGRVMGQRIPRHRKADILWQGDRQIALRHRHDAAIRAMNDRDRTTPIALS